MEAIIKNINNKLEQLKRIQTKVEYKYNDLPIYMPERIKTYLEFLQDTTDSISFYFSDENKSNNCSKFGYKYLNLLGLLQSIKIQQFIMYRFCALFKKKSTENYYNLDSITSIIEAVCEPVSNDNSTYTSVRNEFDKQYITIKNFNSCTTPINYYELTIKHLEILNKKLGNIISIYEEYNEN